MQSKLIYIIDDQFIGGAQIHLFNLVRGLKGIEYADIEVISLSGEGEIQDRIRGMGVPVRNFSMKSSRDPIFYIDFIKLVFFLLKKKPDIVHTYLDTANVFGVIAAKYAGVRTIITSRRDLGVFRSRRMEKLIGLLSNKVHKVVCVCEAAARESIRREGLQGRNVQVIQNGNEIERFQNRQKQKTDNLIFWNVAVANRKEKGHDDLIRAFRIVADKIPNAILRLVGDGPLLPGLKDLANNLGIADRVEFVGCSNDIPSMLKDTSIFVLPSHSEGISNALLQAMAMGIPAVATNVGGNPDVVVHGVTGMRVEARDPESMAQSLIKMAGDRVRLEQMGYDAARRVTELFNFDQMVKNYDGLYNTSLVSKHE
ncbi:MAG TPA: hypothetical protein DEG92_02950 [Rikenellaceae bacterium]|nr:hypothetical protein [Rikenellaceae bacterium]